MTAIDTSTTIRVLQDVALVAPLLQTLPKPQAEALARLLGEQLKTEAGAIRDL